MKRTIFAAAVAAGVITLFSSAPAQAACSRDDSHCKSLMDKAKKIRARDPVSEARTEMAAGNYKLGRVFRYGDPVVYASSHMPGVECRVWPRALISKEVTGDDVILPGEDEHAQAAIRYLEVYNRTKVSAPGFPWHDVCAKKGTKRAAAYDGPVTTATEAARSGNTRALEALNPSPEALNVEDVFGITPLGWAMDRKDLAMGLALIERGADTNALGWIDGPTPLGLAILSEDYAAARTLRKKGAKLYQGTGLCPREEEPMFVEAPLSSVENPPADDREAVPPVGRCSWAGLLLQRGQIDLLIELFETAPPYQTPDPASGTVIRNEVLDGQGDTYNAFKRAVRDGDMALAGRLERWLFGVGDESAGNTEQLYYHKAYDSVEWLYRYKAYDLMFNRFVMYIEAARSPVEAELWKTAMMKRQATSFAMLWDYGFALNHLTPEQLPSCEAAVVAGDQTAIADLCIRASFVRAEAIYAAIRAKDTPRLKPLLAQSASLREFHKPLIDAYIARYGRSDMLDLLPLWPMAQTRPNSPLYYSAAVDGQRILTGPRIYDGPLKAELDTWVRPYLSFPAEDGWMFNPLGTAVRNDDTAMARGLAARGYRWLSNEVLSNSNTGRGLDRDVPGSGERMYSGVEDTERYPSRPDQETWARLGLFVPLIAEVEGPEALRKIFEYAARYGWNDVVDMIAAAGFDAKATKAPVALWRSWAGDGFSGLCKPSTGRRLLALGLPIGPVGENEWTVLRVAAAVCRNPQAIRFLVSEVGVDINELDGTVTALDEAMARRRPEIVAVLKELGGKTGQELVPDKIAERRQEVMAKGADPDFWQSE